MPWKMPKSAFHEDDAQAAEQPLQADDAHGDGAQDFHPLARLDHPEPDAERQREQPDPARKQAVRVFVKNTAHPVRDRKRNML